MSIREIIAMVNQMQAEGVIEQYAIGGAVGATFFLEPVATVDIDIFVTFRPQPNSLMITTQPISAYLLARGAIRQGEYLVVDNWPIQFLPPPTVLVEEALAQAVTLDIDGVPARVFTAEHLAAIALELGRAKDKARLLQFIEEAAIDAEQFQEILSRHRLQHRWRDFERAFLEKPQ